MKSEQTIPIKVNIVDNHPLAILGVKTMLQTCKEILIVEEFTSGTALLAGLEQRQPDVLLLDIMLSDMNGKDLAKEITQRWPQIALLALTSLDAPTHVKIMMRNGCKGYLLKETDKSTLVYAIKEIAKGKEFIDPTLKELMLQNMLKLKKDTFTNQELTPREREILILITQEYNNQEIAEKLFISQRTVEMHRFSLSKKLGVKNLAGLVKIAIQMGLVKE